MQTAQPRPALELLAQLADPDSIRPGVSFPHGTAPRANAHIHLPPNFSAFASVEQALDLAGEQCVRVLGCSNYYNFEIYERFADLARQRGIFPIFGLEVISLDESMAADGLRVNDPENPGRFYICGKGMAAFEPTTAEGARILETIRANDRKRMRLLVRKLAELSPPETGTGFTDDSIIEAIAARYRVPPETVYLQERHVCAAFADGILLETNGSDVAREKLKRLYGDDPKADVTDPVAVQNELRSRLVKIGRPAYIEERFVAPAEAVQLILSLGAIPCYPVLADGASPICPFEATPETLIANLNQRNFHCAEFIPLRNAPAVLEQYVAALRSAGIVVTGGTEHNTQTLSPIPPLCLGGKPLPDSVADSFWEGACVVAAHQFLKLNGRDGFVDAEGNPAPGFATHDDRIRHFAGIGEAVLNHYFEAYGR